MIVARQRLYIQRTTFTTKKTFDDPTNVSQRIDACPVEANQTRARERRQHLLRRGKVGLSPPTVVRFRFAHFSSESIIDAL